MQSKCLEGKWQNPLSFLHWHLSPLHTHISYRLKRTCVPEKMKDLYVCHNINHLSNIIITFEEIPITLDEIFVRWPLQIIKYFINYHSVIIKNWIPVPAINLVCYKNVGIYWLIDCMIEKCNSLHKKTLGFRVPTWRQPAWAVVLTKENFTEEFPLWLYGISRNQEPSPVMVAGIISMTKQKFQALLQKLAEPLSLISKVIGLWFRWKNCGMVEMQHGTDDV